jgi:chromosome segregation ATPase
MATPQDKLQTIYDNLRAKNVLFANYKNAVAELLRKTIGLFNKIRTLNNQITQLNNQITQLNNQLANGNPANPGDRDHLLKLIQDLQDQLNQKTRELDNLNNELNAKIADLETELGRYDINQGDVDGVMNTNRDIDGFVRAVVGGRRKSRKQKRGKSRKYRKRFSLKKR